VTTYAPYLLDGKPVLGSTLVARAREHDPALGGDGLEFTSNAARILRRHGHTVELNPQADKEGGGQ